MTDTTVPVKLVLTDEQVEEVLDALDTRGCNPDLYDHIEFKYLKARGGLRRQEGRIERVS